MGMHHPYRLLHVAVAFGAQVATILRLDLGAAPFSVYPTHPRRGPRWLECPVALIRDWRLPLTGLHRDLDTLAVLGSSASPTVRVAVRGHSGVMVVFKPSLRE